jgi:hypothetical protein
MTLHDTARLLELHGRNPPLRHHPISHNPYGEPRSFPCSSPDLANRPWRSTPGARRPRPSPASGYTRIHVHTRDHAVTTPPAPRSSPARLAVVTMSSFPPGSPPIGHMGTRSPALSPGRLRRAPTDPQKPLPAQPSHQEACMRDLTVGKHRRAAVRREQCPREPRLPPRHHQRARHCLGKLSPTLIGCQRRRRTTPASTSPAGTRRRWKQRLPLASHTHMHPMHADHRERRVDAVHRKETQSTVD